MKPGDRRYTIEVHASGQPRAYADTVRDFTVRVEWIPYKKREQGEPLTWEPNDLHEALITKMAKAHQPWCEPGEGDWASPKLKSKTKVGIGQWRYVVTEAYTD